MKCQSKKIKTALKEQSGENLVKSLQGIIMSINNPHDDTTDAEIELEMEGGRIVLFFVNPNVVIKNIEGATISMENLHIDTSVKINYLMNDKNQKEIVTINII
ncbi:MAG: hypothetical protein ACMUIP_12905 [bacterium]